MTDPGQYDAFWATVDRRIDERIAKALTHFGQSYQPRGAANIAITTGATGIPLVGDLSLHSPQAFIRVPFPFLLDEAYVCLDLADSIGWALRVFFPTIVGGSGPVSGSGIDPIGSVPNTLGVVEQHLDVVAAGWLSRFFPAGSNIILHIVSAGGLASVFTVNLIGRVVF